jgi:hypothetical protein
MITNFLNKGSEYIKKGVGKIGSVTGIGQTIGSRLAAAGLPLGGIFGRQESALPQQPSISSGTVDWAVTIGCPQFDQLMAGSKILSVMSDKPYKGVRFPTTPAVFMSHSASYDSRAVLHNNYPYYAYQNSQVDSMTINGNFPVMNKTDGQNWLATVHFLRTVTKMYYGRSDNQGNPPPVCKLNGYGEHVFQNVPVIITNFTVDLRQDVDYIPISLKSTKTETLVSGGDLLIENLPPLAGVEQGVTGNNAGIKKYGPIASQVEVDGVTYVPTDSMITVQCIPVYSRNKISKWFNLKDFAAGNLAKDGFI